MMENHGCGTGIGGRHENRGLVQFKEVAGATAATGTVRRFKDGSDRELKAETGSGRGLHGGRRVDGAKVEDDWWLTGGQPLRLAGVHDC